MKMIPMTKAIIKATRRSQREIRNFMRLQARTIRQHQQAAALNIQKSQKKASLIVKPAMKAHHAAWVANMETKAKACKTKKCRDHYLAIEKRVSAIHARVEKFKANKGKMSRKQVRAIESNTKKFEKMQAKRTKAIVSMIEKRMSNVQDMIEKRSAMLVKRLNASTQKLNKD